MDLRLATEADLFECTFLMKNFIMSSDYKDLFDVSHATEFARSHLKNPNGVTIVLEDDKRLKGILAAVSSMHPFVPVVSTCDLCWWVEPDARKSRKGLELLKAYEYWAINIKKAKLVTMASMNDERVDKIYKHMGYQKTEHAWTKRIV